MNAMEAATANSTHSRRNHGRLCPRLTLARPTTKPHTTAEITSVWEMHDVRRNGDGQQTTGHNAEDEGGLSLSGSFATPDRAEAVVALIVLFRFLVFIQRGHPYGSKHP